MSSESASTKVIFLAFSANLGIAIAKFIGAFVSGSSSLLAEAIHSLADCTNQVFLFIGAKRSIKNADDEHPLGYGREAFFWSFIVAMLLFSMGGLFAIYEGIHKIHEVGEVQSPLLGLGILFLGLILESISFFACLKEVTARNNHGSLWNWFKNTKSSELLVIFTEDAAALLGLTIAAIGLLTAWITGNLFWDALGSIAVGILLVVVALLLGIEVKSFIIGESSSKDIEKFYQKRIPELFSGGKLLKCIGLQTGSHEVMVTCKMFPGNVKNVDEAIDLVNKLEEEGKRTFPEIRWQFIEIDNAD